MEETSIKPAKHNNYLYKQWVSLCGPGWSVGEVWFNFLVATALGILLPFYAYIAGYEWSIWQMIIAGVIIWDLTGGAIGYNTNYLKKKRAGSKSILTPLHHNLVHIHPLMVAFFYVDWMLPWLFGYWLVVFILYSELMEPKPKVGRRGEISIIVYQSMVGIGLMASAFLVEGAQAVYGLVTFVSMIVLTLVVFFTPLKQQRFAAAIGVVVMCCINGTVIEAPKGFIWLVPVLFIKLILGFTAKDGDVSD